MWNAHRILIMIDPVSSVFKIIEAAVQAIAIQLPVTPVNTPRAMNARQSEHGIPIFPRPD
jgi:hypothetical protein